MYKRTRRRFFVLVASLCALLGTVAVLFRMRHSAAPAPSYSQTVELPSESSPYAMCFGGSGDEVWLAYADGFYRWTISSNAFAKVVPSPLPNMHVTRMEWKDETLVAYSSILGDCFVVDCPSATVKRYGRFGPNLKCVSVINKETMLFCYDTTPWSITRYDVATSTSTAILTSGSLNRGDIAEPDEFGHVSMFPVPKSPLCVIRSTAFLAVVDYRTKCLVTTMPVPPYMVEIVTENGCFIHAPSTSGDVAQISLSVVSKEARRLNWPLPKAAFVTAVSDCNFCPRLAIAYADGSSYSRPDRIVVLDAVTLSVQAGPFYSQSRVMLMSMSPDCCTLAVAEARGKLGAIRLGQK
jgi:hypothetical protein